MKLRIYNQDWKHELDLYSRFKRDVICTDCFKPLSIYEYDEHKDSGECLRLTKNIIGAMVV